MMYWPSVPSNGVYVFKETVKDWLEPNTILNTHPEWRDPARLPISSRESKANSVKHKTVQDPLEKSGTVGLFNRAYYPITMAIDEFLSDVYESTDNENRYHLIESRSMAGVEIIDNGKFVYSHHAKDIAYMKLCNAFDIVRLHKFGDDDTSFKAMCEFALQQDAVRQLAASERLEEAKADFTNDDWHKKLRYTSKGAILENSLYNAKLIMQNDPYLKN